MYENGNENATSWQVVWRKGLAPLLSDRMLEVLRVGLESDDRRILQGATTSPPPLVCVQDWPVEAACPIGFCGWQGGDLQTVGEVEEFFARCCFEIDQALGEPAGCRWLLNWIDETPREEMRAALLREVENEQEKRVRAKSAPAQPKCA